jgi:transglutaminase-like putative cysteine protease
MMDVVATLRTPISATVFAAPDPSRVPPAAPALRWVLAGFLGAVLLNLHHIAAWCIPVALGSTAWRLRAGATATPLMGGPWRVGVVAIMTVAVLLSFRTLNGVSAGASLLVAMAALKLMETHQARDWLIVIGSALFLLLAACLDAQELWRLPLYAAELWLLCTALYALGPGNASLPAGTLLRAAGRGLLVALPLAIVLFLFFPRLAGAFWAVPRPDEARTGLGDDMSPGSISRLVESDEPALRVRAAGLLPRPTQRYWRGPVLHDFDGYTWRRRRTPPGEAPALEFYGESYRYEVTLEPNTHQVLIGLDMPRPDGQALQLARPTFDYQLIVPQALDRPLHYQMESFPHYRSVATLSPAARRLDLNLPVNRNPRSVELARSLRAQAPSDSAFIDAVLDYFRRGNFEYTLTPPLLDPNSIDDLLFRTHEGFCGHYASAFAMLMRAGGVPARVVTGYLGGQWNPFGRYLLVRQADAHAWTEVWLDGRGWMRVDPTSVVAPGRLTDGFDPLGAAGFGAERSLRSALWMRSTVQAWQAMNAWWQDQFVSFNFTKQLSLLNWLGLPGHDWRELALLLAAGGALWSALIAWRMAPSLARSRPDALGRAWQELERALHGRVAARLRHEGPIAFADRVEERAPHLAGQFKPLAVRYARLRYGAGCSAAQLQQFRRAVRLFRARARA